MVDQLETSVTCDLFGTLYLTWVNFVLADWHDDCLIYLVNHLPRNLIREFCQGNYVAVRE